MTARRGHVPGRRDKKLRPGEGTRRAELSGEAVAGYLLWPKGGLWRAWDPQASSVAAAALRRGRPSYAPQAPSVKLMLTG